MADFAAKWTLLQRNVHPAGPVTLDDVPAYLRERFVGKSGRYLLQIFARENIWEREPMQAFVNQLQTVDADVTGPPVVAFYSITNMQQGYVRGGVYALITIAGPHVTALSAPQTDLPGAPPSGSGGPLDDPLHGALWRANEHRQLNRHPLVYGHGY